MGLYTKILRKKGHNKLMNDKKVHERAYKHTLELFNVHKNRLITNFKSHPVTKEILSGPDAINESGTIIGPGNLFSFIGFYNSDRPISPVLQLLMSGITLSKVNPKITKGKSGVFLSFEIKIPTERDFAQVSRMPWETGSWLYRIERGMSGLGYYIYEKSIRASRSGTGIQADGKIRTGMYKRTSYFSALLSTFRKKVGKNI